MGFGVYVHIPFCKRKCLYCNFYSAVGDEVPEAYVQALLRELEKHRPRLPNGEPLRPNSLYFGGGTPGLLSPKQVKRLVEAVNPLPQAEVSLELNPESTRRDVLEGFLKAGINRTSFGVQTAREDSLRRLGRLHTAQQAKEALENAKEVGFKNISGDLMLALPGYSEAEFCESLELLQEGGVCHISAYLLKMEAGTAFGDAPPPDLPSEDEAAEIYLFAAEKLQKAGFARYEISNFAKPGRESRHNLLYWNCEDYLGLGPAAHSCLAARRFSFSPNTCRFIEGDTPLQEEGELGAEDYLLLRLRLEEGFSESAWAERFSAYLSEAQKQKFEFFSKAGFAKRTQQGWALTGAGMLVQNSLLAELLEEE